MNTARRLPGLLSLVLVTGCGQGAPGLAAPPGETRDVVRTLDARLVVTDVARTTERLRAATARLGGDVARSETTHDGAARSTLELRVPAERIDAFRTMLHGLGEVATETETSTDVTDRRVDLDARLASAHVAEQRLEALLGRTPANVAEVISVEHELAAVRERIEQMEAERATLADRVAYARARVDVGPRGAPFWRHPIAAVGTAFDAGVALAASLSVGAACAVAATSPTVLLALAPLACASLLVRLARRRRRTVAA